jgi:hypothetical protein
MAKWQAQDGTIFNSEEQAHTYSLLHSVGYHQLPDTTPLNPTTQPASNPNIGKNVAPYTPGTPISSFLQSLLEEQVNKVVQDLQAEKARRLQSLTEDYNRYVALTEEDKAKNIENTNIAYAQAKERALGGYQTRGLYDSGVKQEGQQGLTTENLSKIEDFKRAAARAEQEQKITYERSSGDIERSYNQQILSAKQQLANVSSTLLSAYA